MKLTNGIIAKQQQKHEELKFKEEEEDSKCYSAESEESFSNRSLHRSELPPGQRQEILNSSDEFHQDRQADTSSYEEMIYSHQDVDQLRSVIKVIQKPLLKIIKDQDKINKALITKIEALTKQVEELLLKKGRRS
jgi:hypothetical protein